MNAAQAIEFRRPLKTSVRLEKLLTKYRKTVKTLVNDRILHYDINASRDFLYQENF
jgi:histidine ammonia-lyase